VSDRPTLEAVTALSMFGFIVLLAAVSIGSYVRRAPATDGIRGSKMLGPRLRGWYFETLSPFEDLFVRYDVSPTTLSVAQLLGGALVGYCYARGLLLTAGWLLLATGSLDIIDGRVARRTNGGSARGAFLDSVVDRYADSMAFFGLAVYFRSSWVLWVTLFALVGSVMVSYTRARGEGLGVECHVGFMQRPERYVILGFGTIFGVLLTFATGGTPTAGPVPLLVLTLLVIAVLANLSALQRARHVWRALGERGDG
jgi:CDP-diacylglycerol--glycerol-3-phosphate 3-phosphatidyltransferase